MKFSLFNHNNPKLFHDYPHFTDKEIEKQRLSNFLKVNQPVSGKVGFKLRQCGTRAFILNSQQNDLDINKVM